MEIIKIVKICHTFGDSPSYYFIDDSLRFTYRSSFKTLNPRVIKLELDKKENIIKDRYQNKDVIDYCDRINILMK